MVMQITQTWRQTVYWRWLDDNGEWQGGCARDLRMMWGMRFSGAAFFRTISTITVKYITYMLMTKWAPNIKCKKTRAWMRTRKDAGMTQEQCMAGFIQAFLDDFWIVITSSLDEDLQLAYELVMEGFKYLGWTLSMSKFEEEGRLATEGVLIGHHVETETATRGVMQIKQERVEHAFAKMLGEVKWDRTELMQTTGLVESIRDDMRRNINLRPLYKAIHAQGDVQKVHATERGRLCMNKIRIAITERRSLWARPTRWVIPSMSTVRMVPNGDASGQIGYAGILWRDNDLMFFHGRWSEQIKEARVNIAFLEAWVVIMITATWGHLFEGRKVVIRSDSMATCFALNKQWAVHKGMQIMCELWEDLQFYFAFQGLILHVPGKDNRLSDIGSRIWQNRMEEKLQEEMAALNMEDVVLKEQDVVWSVGDVDIAVEELLLQLPHTEHQG